MDDQLATFNLLDDETLFIIIKLISVSDAFRLRLVNRQFNRVAIYRIIKDINVHGDESIIVWRLSLKISKQVYISDEQDRIQINYEKFSTKQQLSPIEQAKKTIEDLNELLLSDDDSDPDDGYDD